jgi:hypothetical protein
MAIRPMYEAMQLRHENFKSVNNGNFDFPKTTYGGITVNVEFGDPVKRDSFYPRIPDATLPS